MFRIKICGITNLADARMAAEAGADAIGLNFYPASPRFCRVEDAQEIAKALPAHVCKVGVFVNSTNEGIRQIVESVGLDLVQLHGDEPVDLLKSLRGVPVMRAFRIADDLAPVADYLGQCFRQACVPRLALVDALRKGQYGGTGATLDWDLLRKERSKLAGLPLILSGGLKPSNVVQAIDTVRPWGVDVASGVEQQEQRKKSAELVHEFVAHARAAFAKAAAPRY